MAGTAPSRTDQDTEPFHYCFRVPHDPRAVGVARASLRAVLRAHRMPELVERAELLAGELLANAVVHGTGEPELRLRWTEGTLRLSVWDTSPVPPAFRDVDEDSEHGRGLYLLQILADRWDHFLLDARLFGAGSKVVWCEIGAHPAEGGP